MSNTMCLPFTDFNPEMAKLPALLPQLGFRPLSSAMPADLPAGALVHLYNIKTFSFKTVVVRDLDNGIFFYTHQTGLSHDSWYNALLGHLVCKDYLYKVIS